MEPRNIKEAKELIAKYRSITIEDIEAKVKELKTSDSKISFTFKKTANAFTGFGDCKTCILCKAVTKYIVSCSDCIYQQHNGCMQKNNENTYFAINNAKSSKSLLIAFNNRADHIERILEKFNTEEEC